MRRLRQIWIIKRGVQKSLFCMLINDQESSRNNLAWYKYNNFFSFCVATICKDEREKASLYLLHSEAQDSARLSEKRRITLTHIYMYNDADCSLLAVTRLQPSKRPNYIFSYKKPHPCRLQKKKETHSLVQCTTLLRTWIYKFTCLTFRLCGLYKSRKLARCNNVYQSSRYMLGS